MATTTAPRGKYGRPQIRTTAAMMDYWGERITARVPSDEYPSHEHREYSSIIMDGDRLYHYGHHFCLARIIRRPNGRARMVLLNGDEYRGSGGFGPSTSSRQMDTRAIAERETAGTNILVLTVPFSALDAAGIDQTTIEPLEMRDDWYECHHHTSRERPGDPLMRPDPNGATYAHTSQRNGYVDSDGNPVRYDTPGATYGTYTHVEEKPVMVELDDRSYIDDKRVPNHHSKYHHGDGTARLQDDGLWHWETWRHWLGDSVFKARVQDWRDGERRDRTAKFLSSFDYNEPWPLYFLCELPRTSARTVDEALEVLKPKTVLAAEGAGLEVLRQGDVFAIPTALTTSELKSRAIPHSERVWVEDGEHGGAWEQREVAIRSRSKHGTAADVLGTNHRATHLVITKDGDHYGRGVLYHDPSGWGRTPDHVRVKLGDGKTWYRLVKNTVPQGRGSSNWSVNQSGQSRAWTLGGNVD